MRGLRSLVLAALLVAPLARAEGTVHVPAQVAVEAPVIALGDIAVFDGIPPQLEARLALLAFGPSGAAASEQLLAGERVRGAIQAVDPGIRVDVPEQIRVHRSGVRLGREALQARAEQAIRHVMPWPAEAVHFERWTLPEAITAPPGCSRLLVHFRSTEDFRDRVALELELVDPDSGEPAAQRWGGGVSLDVRLPVAVTTRALRRGELVESDAVRLETRPLRAVPRDAALQLDPLLGQQLAVPVREGVPLTLSQLASEDLVRRGDPLLVSAGSGPLELRLEARALEPGKLGQLIRARNPDSHRELPVIVTGPREARLAVPDEGDAR